MEKQLQQLQEKNKKTLIVGSVVTLLLIVVNWFVLSVVSQQQKQLIEAKRTVVRLKEENASVAQTIEFLSSNADALTQFSRSVPDEERFLNFVTSVEKITKEFATDQSLRFGSTVPLKDKNNLYIPFSLSFTAPNEQIAPFLRRFERLPYITQITTISIEEKQGIINNAVVQLTARIYVENPFTH